MKVTPWEILDKKKPRPFGQGFEGLPVTRAKLILICTLRLQGLHVYGHVCAQRPQKSGNEIYL